MFGIPPSVMIEAERVGVRIELHDEVTALDNGEHSYRLGDRDEPR